MMQQTAVHPATLRQLLPFWSLLCAVVWVESVRALRGRHVAIGPAIGLLLGVLGLFVPQVLGTVASLRIHWDAGYRDPLLRDEGWAASAEFGSLRQLPEGSVILTNQTRLPFIRYWSRRPAYQAANAVSPDIREGRNDLELIVNHLRDLYTEQMPHLLYLYEVPASAPQAVAETLTRDPLLRGLTMGRFVAFDSSETHGRAVRAFLGDGPSACPILARGSTWRVFDMAPIQAELVRQMRGFGIPMLKDLPTPR